MPRKSTKQKVATETVQTMKPAAHHRRRWSMFVPAFSFLLLIFAIALAIYLRYFAYTVNQQYGVNSTSISDISSSTSSSGSSGTASIAPGETKATSGSTSPLVVKTGSFIVTVASASDSVQKITDIATQLKGMVVSSTVNENNTSCNSGIMPMYYSQTSTYPYSRCYDAVITIRVPADSYAKARDAVQKVDENAKFDSESTQETDVTTQSSDLQTQLDSYKSEQDALQKLLTSVKSVDDILKIRTELTRVDAQVQSLQVQIRDLAKNILYSELGVSMSKLGATETVTAPSVSGRFAIAWASMKQDMSGIGTALIFFAVYALIYVPVLVVLLIVFWLIKRLVHRSMKLKK